ncbi:glucosylceramidase [Ereboglobus sp. PH5-5]|nr:glucosylceramidase [Ereboglobus sp. PH5-5]
MRVMSPLKTFLLVPALIGSVLSAFAGSYVPKDNEIQFRILQTTKDKALREVASTPFTRHEYSLLKSIDLDAARPSHEYFGIGVSMTDASCWLLSQMDIEARHKVLKEAFSSRGMNISMIRLNCGSSDYATELYNYNDHEGDVEMKKFSVARDEAYMIPIIKRVHSYRSDLFTYAAVWSVPGWMKDSGAMCGGSLLDKYLPSFAAYWTAYLKAYKERGVRIDAVSVQNEPGTDQRGGCPATLVSAKQEIELAGKLMPAAFKEAGLDTEIWLYDWDYEGRDRVNQMLADPDVKRNAAAVAWHPYAGKPEMMREVLKQNPGTKMHLTERGPNLALKDIQTPKWWSEVIFGALNNGCSSFTSWNLLLDEDGQPNTGRFPCGGLMSIDTETGKVSKSTQCAVFYHFSPYVKRGAQIMAIEQPDDALTAITFKNPDGQYVIVVAAGENPKVRQRFQVKFKNQYLAVCLPLNSWSLTTVIIDKQ